MFQSFSLIFLIAALFSYLNYRWLKLPSTIGIMILSLITAILVIVSEPIFPNGYKFFCDLVLAADFRTLLLDVMLSLLLFAGALHVDIRELKKEKWSVFVFATIGVLLSTVIVGTLVYYTLPIVGIEIPLTHALLFGALISPTDPIAVIAILKKAGVTKSLQLKIEGESLFNDGVGVVVFTGILLFVEGMGEGMEPIGKEIMILFVEEVVGGIVLGALIGVLAFRLMKGVQENPQLCIILSIAFAIGGYSIASIFHMSGPLAMVVAGLYLGHKIFHQSFNEKSKKHLDDLWEVLDEGLNGVLFVMIGLAIHLLNFDSRLILGGLIAILIVTLARWISITVPFSFFKHQEHDFWQTTTILTWGGLKGGISLALALSLTDEISGPIILGITYIVVLFSIFVQGLSISKLVKILVNK